MIMKLAKWAWIPFQNSHFREDDMNPYIVSSHYVSSCHLQRSVRQPSELGISLTTDSIESNNSYQILLGEMNMPSSVPTPGYWITLKDDRHWQLNMAWNSEKLLRSRNQSSCDFTEDITNDYCWRVSKRKPTLIAIIHEVCGSACDSGCTDRVIGSDSEIENGKSSSNFVPVLYIHFRTNTLRQNMGPSLLSALC